MRDIRVASVQFEHVPNDKPANMLKIESFVEQAVRQGIEILAFPECCITGYWHLRHLSQPELLDLAEPVSDGPSSRRLVSLARQARMTIGAGLIEVDADGRMYNTYVVAMPNGEWRRHRKIHAFVSQYLTSGSEYTVFDSPHGCRIGVLICYDCKQPQEVIHEQRVGIDWAGTTSGADVLVETVLQELGFTSAGQTDDVHASGAG